MKKDNRGVTLVELIIVIAIMAVVITMLGANMYYMYHSAAKGCANSLKTAIGQTRIKTMGKKETYLYIYKDGNGYSMKTISIDSTTGSAKVETTESLVKSKVAITYTVKDGAATLKTVDSDPLLIGFKRESGKLDMTTTGFTCDDGTTIASFTATDVKGLEINVQSGNNIYDITIHGATGKTEMAKR